MPLWAIKYFSPVFAAENRDMTIQKDTIKNHNLKEKIDNGMAIFDRKAIENR